MPLNVKLVVVGGDVKTTEITLRLPSTIGRGRGTTIVLPHPLVSRQHCELFEADGQLMVRDLGSLNGTFVNNERVTEAPLAPGELLTVGTVTFRAVYESDEAPPPGLGPKLKGGEKTVHATKATTRAAPPKPAAPQKANDDSAPLEFDFGQPLLPVDEEVRPTERRGATQVTERLDATVANKATQAAAPKSAKGSTKPAAGKSSPAKKPADATVDVSKRNKKDGEEDEADDKVESASDEDLNDFLDSLGNK
jgi:predicted component of type VI protein secretion system